MKNDFEVSIKANVDESTIKKDLENIKDLSVKVNKVDVSNDAISDLRSKLKNEGVDVNLVLSDTSKVEKQATQAGQQIGSNISKGISNAKSSVKKSIDGLTDFSQLNKKVTQIGAIMRDASSGSFTFIDNGETAKLSNYQQLLQKIHDVYSEFGQVKITNKQFDNGELTKFKVNLEQVDGDLKETRSFWMQLNESMTAFQYDGIINGSEAIVEHLDKEKNVVNKTAEEINKLKLAQKEANIKFNMDNGDGVSAYQNQINDLINKFEKYGLKSDEARQKTAQLQAILNEMNGDVSGEKLVNMAEQLDAEFAKVKISVANAKLSFDKFSQPVSGEKTTSLINRINSFLSKNTRITKEARQELESYVRRLEEGANLSEWNQMNSRLKETESDMRLLNKLGKSLKDQLKQAKDSFMQWISVSTLVMTLVNQIRKIPEEVYEVNKAMIELQKVSDATSAEVTDYFDKAAESAKKYGASISDVISSTADWSRLGYNLDESQELAEAAVLYTNVGDDIDMDTATESLESTLQGFQLDADEAIDIVDKFNEVANNFPIDSAGIGEALERSAASFYAANTDLSKSIALITGTNSVVQDPDSVGTMWKTVSMRIRGAESELEEAGLETDGMVETTSELRDLVMGMTGFDIMEDDDTFKDIYDIVVGIGKEWDNLTDIEQASLLEKLAGKRQGNALSAALSNIDMIEDAYATATNSAGSALEEQEEYEKGIEYSLNQLSAKFQELSNDMLDSGTAKNFVDFGGTIIGVLDAIIDKTGVFIPVVGAISAALTKTTNGGLGKIILDKTGVTEALGGETKGKELYSTQEQITLGVNCDESEFEKLKADIRKLNGDEINIKARIDESDIDAIKNNESIYTYATSQSTRGNDITLEGLNARITQQNNRKIADQAHGKQGITRAIDEYNKLTDESSQAEFTKAIKETNTTLGTYLSNLNGSSASFGKYITSAASAKAKTYALNAASMALNSVIGMGVSLAIEVGISAISNLITAEERAAERAEGFTETLQSFNSEISDNASSISELADKYTELSKGVDNLGYNVSLSADEYDEYKSVVKDLSEIMPSLTNVFNGQGEAIGFVNGKLQDVMQTYQKYLKTQATDYFEEGDDEGNHYQDVLNQYYKDTYTDSGAQAVTKLKKINELSELTNGFTNVSDIDTTWNRYDKEAFMSYTGIGISQLKNAEGEELQSYIDEINAKKAELHETIDHETNEDADFSGVSSGLTTNLYTNDDYLNATSEMQDKIMSFTSSITGSLFNMLDIDITNEDEVRGFGDKVVTLFTQNVDGFYNAYAQILNFDTEDMDLSVPEAREKLDNWFATILTGMGVDESNIDDAMEQIRTQFGLGDWYNDVSDKYDDAINYYTPRKTSKTEEKINQIQESNRLYQFRGDEVLVHGYKNITEQKDAELQYKDKLQYEQDEWTEEKIKALMDELKVNDEDELNTFITLMNRADSLDELKENYLRNQKENSSNSKLSFTGAWSQLEDDNEDLHDSLLELAEAGELTDKTFSNLEGTDSFLEDLGLDEDDIDRVVKKINKLADSTKQLESLEGGITNIETNYDTKQEDGYVSASDLSSTYDTLGIAEWGEKDLAVWEDYKNAAADSSTTLSEFKKKQDALATSFMDNGNYLANLTEKNKDYYVSSLKSMGIVNAEKVVQEQLNQNKVASKVASIDLTNATGNEIANLANEITQIDATSDALGYYALKKALANDNALSTSDSIANLKTLAKQCGITGKAIQLLTAMESNQTQLENLDPNDQHSPDIASNIEYENEQLAKQIKNIASKKLKTESSGTNTANGTGKTDGNSGSNSSSNSKETIDWISRALDRVSSKIDLVQAKYDALFTNKKITSSQSLVAAENKNLDKQIKLYKKLENYNNKAVKKYTKKANNVNLSSSLKKAVREGRISGDLSTLISQYGEKKANKIQKYQDYYDSAQEAKENAKSARVNRVNAKISKWENKQELADSQIEKYQAQQSVAIGLDKNKYVDKELSATKKSYDYQIKIAKAQKNSVLAKQLEAEKEQAILDLQMQKIDNIKTYYENQLKLLNNDEQDIQNQVSLLQAQGNIVSASYYTSQNDIEQQKIAKYQQELADLQAQESSVTYGSTEWYELQDDIQDVENSINDSQVTIAENTSAIGELNDAMYEAMYSYASSVATEANFLAGLVRGETTDSDTGTFTEAGLAQLYAAGIEYSSSKAAASVANERLKEIQEANASGTLLSGYASLEAQEEAEQTLMEEAQTQTQNIKTAGDTIISLVNEALQAMLDYMQDLVDARKEALEEEQELYEYEKSIAEKTQNVSTIQKQLLANSGDTSEEGRLKQSQLQTSLDEAQQELEDAEYDKYISDQQDMLDNLMDEYQDLMEDLQKDENALLQEGIDAINDNKAVMQNILSKTATEYGYPTSDDLNETEKALASGQISADVLNGNGEDSITSKINSKMDEIYNKYKNGTGGDNDSGSGGGNDDGSGSGSGGGSGSDEGSVVDEDTANDYRRTLATKYITEHVSKAKKKRSKYSDVNKVIYDKWDKKVLSSAELKTLATKAGLSSYDGASKSGKLYKRLKSLGIDGFKTGGIAELIKDSGEDGIAFVRNGEGFIAPEYVKDIQELVEITPQLSSLLPDYTNAIASSGVSANTSVDDMNITFELPNVTDSVSFIDTIQTPKQQKQFAVAVNDALTTSSTLNVRRYK